MRFMAHLLPVWAEATEAAWTVSSAGHLDAGPAGCAFGLLGQEQLCNESSGSPQ